MGKIVPVSDLLVGRRQVDQSHYPAQMSRYPEFRYMGSKRRLLPWIHDILHRLDFESAWDPFSGSGCVSYLMKSMGKRVVSSDFLNFPSIFAKALIENPGKRLDGKTLKLLLKNPRTSHSFIEQTFSGVYFTANDLNFLDRVSSNIQSIADEHIKSIAMTALLRSCLKKQPRGVFTITGDLSKYDDGRRDLRLSIEEHFFEQIEVVQEAVFKNGKSNKATKGDVFELPQQKVDLVYLDPPYVPRSDDNCYVKRYHFLEGLSCYWHGLEVDENTKTKKIPKRYTPFSYRRTALEAFDQMFSKFKSKTIVLSYSSNAYPDLPQLEDLLKKHKRSVRIFVKQHTYHFGNHANVDRSQTTEYLLVGLN